MTTIENYTSVLARNMPHTFTQPFDAVHDNIGTPYVACCFFVSSILLLLLLFIVLVVTVLLCGISNHNNGIPALIRQQQQ